MFFNEAHSWNELYKKNVQVDFNKCGGFDDDYDSVVDSGDNQEKKCFLLT